MSIPFERNAQALRELVSYTPNLTSWNRFLERTHTSDVPSVHLAFAIPIQFGTLFDAMPVSVALPSFRASDPFVLLRLRERDRAHHLRIQGWIAWQRALQNGRVSMIWQCFDKKQFLVGMSKILITKPVPSCYDGLLTREKPP